MLNHRRPIAGFRVFVVRLFSHPSGSQIREYRQPPLFYPYPHSASGTRKPSVPDRRLIQSMWFPICSTTAKRVSRPLKADAGANLQSNDGMGCRRFPISPEDFQTPFRFAATPVYPKSIFSLYSSPFITCHTALLSLQASAFFAFTGILRCFFRSYQA